MRGGANHRHHHRSNQRHHHSTTQRSGSLQDLVEAVHNELDSDYTIGGGGGGSSMQQRRHAAAHNSGRHQKKYSSSVSSRPKEGGSLPTNVNCNLYEETFLNELNKGHNVRNNNNHNHHNHHRAAAAPSAASSSSTSSAVAAAAAAPVASSSTKHLQKVAAHDGAGNSGNFVWLGYEPQGNESGHQVSHTVIEIESDETRHLLAHDSLAQVKFLKIIFLLFSINVCFKQGISDPIDESGSTELNPMKKLPRIAVSYTATQFMNVSIGGDASASSSSFRPVASINHGGGSTVDKTVRFNSFLKGTRVMERIMNETTTTGGGGNSVQLNNSYASVNSVIEQKGSMSLASGSGGGGGAGSAIASTSSGSSGSSTTSSSQVCVFPNIPIYIF